MWRATKMIRVRKGPVYRAIRAGEPVPEADNWNAGMRRKQGVKEVPDVEPEPEIQDKPSVMPDPAKPKASNTLMDFVDKKSTKKKKKKDK